jgi:hypothetical protein
MWRSTVTRVLAAVFAVVMVSGLAAPAGAVTPGHYSISATGGATFSLFTSNNLVSGTVDDQLFYLSTTGTGLQRLPFPIKVWNGSFSQVAVSSNGNVQMGIAPGGGNAAFSNGCFPSSQFVKPVVAPYWDDLFFDSNDTSHGFIEGVFTKTKGTAPHRKFVISWQGHEFNNSGALVQAQVVFQEGSTTFTMIYGHNGGASATIGTQSAQAIAWAQWACNSGSTSTVVAGQKLTFLHSS